MTMFSALALISIVLATAAPVQGPPAVDPCTLITRAEAEEAIGPLKQAPRSRTEERVRICEFEGANDRDSLEVWVFPPEGLERARATYKDLTPVTDLGQPAFFRKNTDVNWFEIFARKGAVTLEMTMSAAPGGEEKLKALTRKARGRLTP